MTAENTQGLLEKEAESLISFIKLKEGQSLVFVRQDQAILVVKGKETRRVDRALLDVARQNFLAFSPEGRSEAEYAPFAQIGLSLLKIYRSFDMNSSAEPLSQDFLGDGRSNV